MLAKQLHMYQVHQENGFVFAYLVELLAIILSPTLNIVRHKRRKGKHRASGSSVVFYF